MEISVGARGSVRYLVEVRYSECPLVESPLYYSKLITEHISHYVHVHVHVASDAPGHKITCTCII